MYLMSVPNYMKTKFIPNFKNNSNKIINSFNDCIMRDYVERKLYFENDAYYSNSTQNFKDFPPLGRLEKPLDFVNMRGIGDYALELNSKYPKSTWLTCSELLRPYFGYAIGNYILTKHLENPKSKNIKIVEVGCGMGGAIDSILEYLRIFSIKHYKEVEYIGLEMTHSLSTHTNNLLKENHPDLYRNNQIHIIDQSLYDYNINSSSQLDEEVFIIAFNLIDSIGHDKITLGKGFHKIFVKSLKDYYNNLQNFKEVKGENFKTFLNQFIQQYPNLISESHVENINGKFTEVYKPLKDELIKDIIFYNFMPLEEKCLIMGEEFLKIEHSRTKANEEWFVKLLKKVFNYSGYNNKIWLPTNSLKFFDTINMIFPKHKLLLLDFDFIPSKLFNCDYKGKNAPAVYSIKENSYDSITHPSIFSSFETVGKPVNIYFPVDFDLMQIMYYLKTNNRSSVNKFNYFMKQNAMDEWCETKSGFNPLINTHHNLSFMFNI